MEYGVYLESSIVDLKPRVLEFLTAIVEKAKEAKDFAISFKKKELAELTGKDIRTTSRYLKQLEERNVIQMKGVRGRAGGTVVMFNTDLIRFDTSDKALINTDDPVTLDEVVQQKLPKKEKEPKHNKRNRRTKQQMLEAQILSNKKQSEVEQMNSELERMGVPTWEWFKKTDNPVGNYQTYLLSRLYNRYAVLFTDKHNAEVEAYGEGNPVQHVNDNYDVLPKAFYGSARFQQFEKLREFCEENDIDPAVYLSAQFNRSVFMSSAKKNKKLVFPFVNALIGDTAYDVYRQYCEHYKKHSITYQSYFMIPAKFVEDYAVRAIIDAFETASKQQGLLQYSYAIKDFFRGEGSDDTEVALLNFYDDVSEKLRERVSFKTRDSLKKFIILQSLTLTGGAAKLPQYMIMGSETTRIHLMSIDQQTEDKEAARLRKELTLGKLVYPSLSADEQKVKGTELYYQFSVLHETPHVLRLIMERKGLYLSLADLREAFKEYGNDKIPLDDYSIMDVDQIKKLFTSVTEPEIDHSAFTRTRTWDFEGSVVSDSVLADMVNKELQ